MLRSVFAAGSRAALTTTQGVLQPSVRPVLACSSRAMSNTGPGSKNVTHGHSGKSVPADADMKAAQEGEAQFHGSGEPLDVSKDPQKSDPVMGHSGTSVPHDTDVKAAKEGEAQHVGSAGPLYKDTMQTNDQSSGKV